MTIKPSIPGDADWVISIHGTEYSRDYEFSKAFEIDIAAKYSSLRDNADDFYLWIARINGERVGSIAVSKLNENIGFVNFLLVVKEFRKRGIAKELMVTAVHHARKQGYKLLRLETYSCLTDARELYSKTGFQLKESNKGVKKYGQVFDQEFWELDL